MAGTIIFHEGNRLREASSRTMSIISSMKLIDSTINRIHSTRFNAVWEGDASEQNKENYHKLHSIIAEYLEEAEKTKNTLDSAIAVYERTETDQAAKVSQLNTNNIF